MRMIPCMAGWAGPRLTYRCWLPSPVPGIPPSPRKSSRALLSAIGLNFRPDQGLAARDGVVLPQRMPHELLVQEQAAEIGMALEADAEHVPHLALEPVGDGPERGGRGHPRVVLVHRHLEADPVSVMNRIQLMHDVDIELVRPHTELL